MAFYSGSSMINSTRLPSVTACNYMLRQNHTHDKHHENMGTTYHMFGKMKLRTQMEHHCNNNFNEKGNFLQGPTSIIVHGGSKYKRRSSAVHASWIIPNSEIASNAFTFGTVAVLPFYTFMVLAPRASFTKNLVASSAPSIVLGLLYAYLLHLSWAPDTISLIFASKYLMPELSSMAKLLSGEMSVASAWIHLLVVDLFAARQVYFDGLQENIETRHSVFICLFSCPLGILTHFITKALIISSRRGVFSSLLNLFRKKNE